MLSINDWLPECRLACLEEKRIASVCDGCRLQTHHSAKHNATSTQLVHGAQHAPIRGVELIASTGASELLSIDNERLPHPHQVPVAHLIHDHRHGPGRRLK